MSKLNLDLSQVQEQSTSGYSFIPAGKYRMKVVKTDVKENSNKNGHILIVDLMVTDFGDHADKKIPYKMNIVNPSAEAQRIALSQLKSLAIATGHKNPNSIGDSDELITGVEFEVEVTEKEYNGKNYSDVKGVFKNAGTATQDAKSSVPTPPWMKK